MMKDNFPVTAAMPQQEARMLKKYWKPIFYISLVFLALLVLSVIVLRSQKLETDTCTRLEFQGEYSQAGGPWLPLAEKHSVSSLKGDVVLRGHFSADIPAGETLNVYLNHVDYCLLVNGAEVHRSDSHSTLRLPDACSAHWENFRTPAIAVTDEVELHLHNPHSCGDSGAFLDLLDNLYLGPASMLPATLSPRSIFFRSMALLIGGLSLAVLGVALAFTLVQLPATSMMWSLGLISLCMSGYLGLDNLDASLLLSSHVFTTYGELLCLILALLELNRFLSRHLASASRKVAAIAFYIHSATVTCLLLICLSGLMSLYDLLSVWSMAQLLLCPTLLGCCIYEMVSLRICRSSTVAALLLLVCTLAELFGTFFPRYPSGLPVKVTFLILFFLLLVRCIRHIATDHRKAIHAEQLQTQLQSNSILLANSQIRTHFIFNLLNAISGMCKYDPEKADQTIVRFARYLRANIDMIQDDELAPFPTTLRYVEDYVALEQVRFGSKLRFVTSIAADDFLFPPLILQPLVENAIKHGITAQPHGGTVTLQTLWQDGNIIIRVSDDGVGFDPRQSSDPRSVALQNIRFRLKTMVNGKLEIHSTPGQGTTCTITIPEKEVMPCL